MTHACQHQQTQCQYARRIGFDAVSVALNCCPETYVTNRTLVAASSQCTVAVEETDALREVLLPKQSACTVPLLTVGANLNQHKVKRPLVN